MSDHPEHPDPLEPLGPAGECWLCGTDHRQRAAAAIAGRLAAGDPPDLVAGDYRITADQVAAIAEHVNDPCSAQTPPAGTE